MRGELIVKGALLLRSSNFVGGSLNPYIAITQTFSQFASANTVRSLETFTD